MNKKEPEMIFTTYMKDWDNFDLLIQFMVDNCNVTVLEIIEKPNVRICFLEKEGVTFKLVNDDLFGSTLETSLIENEYIIKEIGAILEAAFKV